MISRAPQSRYIEHNDYSANSALVPPPPIFLEKPPLYLEFRVCSYWLYVVRSYLGLLGRAPNSFRKMADGRWQVADGKEQSQAPYGYFETRHK